MSADSQRLKSALRRIVLESPELRELLGDSDNRGDQSGSAGVGTSEAEESRLCCDGSTSDNANPGTSERDPTDGDQDGLNPDDPADLSGMDGGCLTGVTNCDTGDPICFCGDGFIPPDGWDEPNEPPIDPTYTEGEFYSVTIGSTYRAATISLLKATIPSSHEIVPFSSCESGVPECESGYAQQDLSSTSQVFCPGCVSIGTCPDGSEEDYCNPDPEDIQADTWPSDGCTNIAIVNGQIVGSKYDPENDGSYSAPMDEIQLCSGGEQIGLKPAANGGWKTINATTDSGYLWDSHGRKIAHIDGNEYSDPDV